MPVEISSPQTPVRRSQARTPEVREYMVRGVISDEEIGLDSDIATATFGG